MYELYNKMFNKNIKPLPMFLDVSSKNKEYERMIAEAIINKTPIPDEVIEEFTRYEDGLTY